MAYSALNSGSTFVPSASPAPLVNPYALDLRIEECPVKVQLPPEKPKCLGWTLEKQAQFQSGLAVSTRMCLYFIAFAIVSLGICMGFILWCS